MSTVFTSIHRPEQALAMVLAVDGRLVVIRGEEAAAISEFAESALDV